MERATLEHRTREKHADIPFAEEMEAHARHENSFHVFNHPTIALVARYKEKMMALLIERLVLSLADSPPRHVDAEWYFTGLALGG